MKIQIEKEFSIPGILSLPFLSFLFVYQLKFKKKRKRQGMDYKINEFQKFLSLQISFSRTSEILIFIL